jgi:hypothetical protein
MTANLCASNPTHLVTINNSFKFNFAEDSGDESGDDSHNESADSHNESADSHNESADSHNESAAAAAVASVRPKVDMHPLPVGSPVSDLKRQEDIQQLQRQQELATSVKLFAKEVPPSKQAADDEPALPVFQVPLAEMSLRPFQQSHGQQHGLRRCFSFI